MKKKIFIIIILCCIGCGSDVVPREPMLIPLSNPLFEPFRSMYDVDRKKYGLTPLPAKAEVKIERRFGEDAVRAGYDIMLHIYLKNHSRTIAFKKIDNKYRWTSEQEVHDGPGSVDGPDGRISESICVTFSEVEMFDAPKGLWISYFGLDENYESKELTPEDVWEILHKWNFLPNQPANQGQSKPIH